MRALLPEADLVGVAADLATPEGSAALIAQAPDADILVNNVGTARLNNFFAQEDGEWLDLFQHNVMSGVRAARHYVPKMTEHGWGRVVFISSESGLNIPKDMIDYGLTKAAVLAVSRGLAELVAGTGVTVNAVLPGPTNSEILSNWMQKTAQHKGITQEQAEQQFLKTMRPKGVQQIPSEGMPVNTISQSEPAKKSDANRSDSDQTQASRSETVQSIERDRRICDSGDARRASRGMYRRQAEATAPLILE
jgi:NAD(P)-dependent dehydrogenase (short-subunit alcohol dehydrogenase family)